MENQELLERLVIAVEAIAKNLSASKPPNHDEPLAVGDLSVRARRVLKRSAVLTVGDFRKELMTGFIDLPNCGPFTQRELKDYARRIGVTNG